MDYIDLVQKEKNMSRFSELTTDQVHSALTSMRLNRRSAELADDSGLASAFQRYIDNLIDVLIDRNTDPHTTPADIRFFENQYE